MQIQVNGENREFEGELTVRQLIDKLGLGGGPVAVEQNLKVVPRARHETTRIADGDVIEIVHFVGGG